MGLSRFLTIAMLMVARVLSFRSAVRPLRMRTQPILLAKISARNVHANEGSFWKARTGGWRPDVNDVERISWGKPAKKKRTGSRGVPHRLNEEERFLYDQARQKGFLEVAGSGWRSQRREAPLLNTYRSLCDARAQASIVLHKQNTGLDDLVVDLSPLRLPETFQGVAEVCLAERAGGVIAGRELFAAQEGEDIIDNDYNSSLEEDESSEEPSSDWMTRPIYQLPTFRIVWNNIPRAEAKALGKKMAKLFNTAEGKLARSKKPVGVKAGRGRRHGGYGI